MTSIKLKKRYICGYMDQYETWAPNENGYDVPYDERVYTEMWSIGRTPIEHCELINYLHDRKIHKELTVIIYMTISR